VFRGLWERRSHLITKEKKSQQIAELSEKFSTSKAIVLTDYKGLTVSEISDLRQKLKEVGSEYRVAKNTLSVIASKGTPVEAAADHFIGPTAIVFGLEDPVSTVKKVLDFSEKNDKLKVKAGIIDGRLYGLDEIKAISKLPPRDVLLGMLVGAMQAPVSKMVRLLSATVTRFAYALEALKNKKSQ
jgi:large subunit ribosomal protein L10